MCWHTYRRYLHWQMSNGWFVRISKVDQQSRERTVLVSAKSSPANDRFGDSRFIAAMSALRMRANAASAIAAPAKGDKVRIADFSAVCSEQRLRAQIV